MNAQTEAAKIVVFVQEASKRSESEYFIKYHVEKHIKELLEKERDEIANDIRNNTWSYAKIPWKMWVTSVISVILKPKVFFASYYKCIQLKLADKVQNRKYL